MRYRVLDTARGKLSIVEGLEEPIANASDFLGIMAGTPSSILVLKKDDFVEEFYDLRTGIAGEILQKVSNYSRSLVIVGDFEKVSGESLRSFIYESNKGGQVVFAASVQGGIERLR